MVLTPVDAATADGTVHTFGQVFQPGDVADSVVAFDGSSALPTQVDVKRRHPDGSVRHAVISLQAPALSAGEERVLDLKAATRGTVTDLSVSAALAGGFDTEVEIVLGGTTYRASAADLLQNGQPTKWLSGDVATEFQVRGPLQASGAPHPSLEVVFGVRFFSESRARVSVTVENTLHDAPGNLTYDVTVRSGGQTVLQRSAVEHFHHARWRHVFQFGGDAATLHAKPNLAYVIGTGALPKYDLNRAIDAGAVAAEVQAWEGSDHDIMDRGTVVAYMPTTGGRPDIGPLPRWAAISILTGDAGAANVTNGVGDLSGSWSVHYRDSNTGRALSIDDYPTISLNPQANRYSDEKDKLPECTDCNSPYTPDTAHQPSLAFVPYLLTGDHYYLEELYFWTSWNFIHQNQAYREDDTGLLQSLEVRAQAWTIRKLAQAAWIAPDEHPEKNYYETKLDNNFDWYMANAVDSHPLGTWGRQNNRTNGGRPDDNMAPDVAYYTSPWMHDFLLWTWDYAARMGYEKAEPIRAWFGKYVTGRFSSAPDFNPLDGAPYHLAVEDDNGNLFTTWAQVYAKSFAGRTEPTPTTLASGCAFCYPAIARGALTAAVRAGVPKAQEAYDFLDADLRSNDAPFNADPKWHSSRSPMTTRVTGLELTCPPPTGMVSGWTSRHAVSWLSRIRTRAALSRFTTRSCSST